MLALLTYPILLHSAVLADELPLGLTVGLVLLVLWQVRRPLVRATALGGIAGGAWLASAFAPNASYVLAYAAPVLINAVLLFGFARSLRPGETPIIAAVAARIRGELSPRVVRYARQVTQLWVAYFAFCVLETALLAFFAPLEVWSLFTNVLNYALACGLFVGEYCVRRWRLSELEHPGFFAFLRSLCETGLPEALRPRR